MTKQGTVLTVDIGNTLTKALAFRDGAPVGKPLTGPSEPDFIRSAVAGHGAVALASVVRLPDDLTDDLRGRGVLIVDADTPLPIGTAYTSRATLGIDRICAAVGASRLFPGTDVLAIDLGTCITYDMVTADGTHLGGAISPGMRMRFRALAEQTSKLPEVEPGTLGDVTGTDTVACIRSGVMHGIRFEVDAAISHYSEQYPDLKVVATGGDLPLFAKALKSPIFADPFLVLRGLYEIHLHQP